MAAQLALRIEEQAVGFLVGQVVEEGLALAHEVVFEDLTDAPGITQEHLALLAVERRQPILLEEKDAVVSRAAQRGDARIATLAHQTHGCREYERGQGCANQLLEGGGFAELGFAPGASDQTSLGALHGPGEPRELRTQHLLDFGDDRHGVGGDAEVDADLLLLLVEENQVGGIAAHNLGSAAQSGLQKLLEVRGPHHDGNANDTRDEHLLPNRNRR